MPEPKKTNKTTKEAGTAKTAASAKPKAKAASATKPVKKEAPAEEVKGQAYPPALLKVVETLKKDAKWQKFVAEQKQTLLDLRDDVLDSMAGVTRDTLRNHPEGSEASGSGEHQADAGSDAYDRDFALSILSKEQNALYEIEEALVRIENGTYGVCEMCYKPIPILRLKAIPFARLTVECQTQWEKERGTTAKYVSNMPFGFGGGQNEGELSVSLDDDDE